MSTQLYNGFLAKTDDRQVATVQIVTVTPQMAHEWLSTKQFESQRKLRSWHVDFLANEMKKGRFLPATQIRFSVCNGDEKVIDGQHRLSAVIKSGIPQTFTVLRIPEDPGTGYGRIDNGLTRSSQDMFSAVELSEELGIGKDHLNRLGYAVKFIHGDFVTSKYKAEKLANDDLAQMIRQYSHAGEAFFETTAGMPLEMKTGLLRIATLSLALVTFRFASLAFGPLRVKEFWRGVTFDDGLSVGDPRKTANRHILTTSMPGGHRLGTAANYVSAAYSARYIANCWNAWIEKREIKTTRVFDERSKMNLIGTPFNGK